MDDLFYCEAGALGKFMALLASVKQPSKPYRASAAARPLATTGGVAVIDISGPLLKVDNWQSQLLGLTTYHDIHRQLEQAQQSSSVQSIVFRIDSPGGVAAGCDELASAIAKCSKPTIAIIDGLAASAAYYLASQTKTIYATADSRIGSIGVVATLQDISRQLAMAGIKINELTSTPKKISGSPFHEMTSEEREYLLAMVDDLANLFRSAVKSGRPRVSQDAFSGEVWISQKAKSLGLIDSIQPARETLAAIESKYAGQGMTMKLPSVDVPVSMSTLQKSKVSVQRLQWQRRWNEEREQREKLLNDDEGAAAETNRARMSEKRQKLLGWKK